MTTEQLKNWLKAQRPELGSCIRLGTVDANAEYFLGVYPAARSGPAHIALGGAAQTSYQVQAFRLLLRWGKSQPEAETEADALWALFYGLMGAEMSGAAVYLADPGAGPVPLGRGTDGVFEYAINLTITCTKE